MRKESRVEIQRATLCLPGLLGWWNTTHQDGYFSGMLTLPPGLENGVKTVHVEMRRVTQSWREQSQDRFKAMEENPFSDDFDLWLYLGTITHLVIQLLWTTYLKMQILRILHWEGKSQQEAPPGPPRVHPGGCCLPVPNSFLNWTVTTGSLSRELQEWVPSNSKQQHLDEQKVYGSWKPERETFAD